ncbi:MAG: hypothetical protein KatS3mg125_1670 [Lysobacterales bacterium]|jgi:cytochrome c553|nr:MAG: hypothetical protein KatS3mg125_1670 [Xanthomonadales bacterium]
MSIRELLIALAMLPVMPVWAGDPIAGQQKSQPCQACHGPDGNQTVDPSYPKIGGQYEDYLVRAMLAYKNGERENAIMQGFMAPLSERDIRDLAAFYARQPRIIGDLRNAYRD